MGLRMSLSAPSEFHKRAPADRDLRVAKELFRQDEEKQIRAAVANQFVELGAIVEPILQRAQLTQNARVTAVSDHGEIRQIEFGK